MAITLRQVETFRAVLDTGSMTRAAELLGISERTLRNKLNNPGEAAT